MPTSRLAGLVAMLVTVLAWAGFALSVRAISGSSLTSADVALLRFGLPVVLLAWRLPHAIRAVRAEPWRALALIAVGSGLPYFLTAAAGGALTTAGLTGLVIPGSVPLIVAALTLRSGPPLGRARIGGLAAIAVGIAVLAAIGSRGSASTAGVLVLLGAGVLWALYTLGLRATGLSPVDTALVVCVPSFVVTAVLVGTRALPSALLAGTARPADVLLFLVVQGLVVGVVAGVAYASAVRALGPRRSSTIGAVTPVLVLAVSAPLLGEVPGWGTLAGAALVVGGVVAANAAPAPPLRLPPAPIRSA